MSSLLIWIKNKSKNLSYTTNYYITLSATRILLIICQLYEYEVNKESYNNNIFRRTLRSSSW